VLLIMAVFTLSSCAQLGPGLVQAGRNNYNKVLAQTDIGIVQDATPDCS